MLTQLIFRVTGLSLFIIALYVILFYERAFYVDAQAILDGSRTLLQSGRYVEPFAYPGYAAILWSPFTVFPELWLWANVVLAMLSPYLITRNWLFSLLMLSFPPSMWVIMTGQSTLWVALFWAIYMSLQIRKSYELSGVSLALMTVKPQVALVPVLVSLLYANKLTQIFFVFGLLGIYLVTLTLLGNWFGPWIDALIYYKMRGENGNPFHDYDLALLLVPMSLEFKLRGSVYLTVIFYAGSILYKVV